MPQEHAVSWHNDQRTKVLVLSSRRSVRRIKLLTTTHTLDRAESNVSEQILASWLLEQQQQQEPLLEKQTLLPNKTLLSLSLIILFLTSFETCLKAQALTMSWLWLQPCLTSDLRLPIRMLVAWVQSLHQERLQAPTRTTFWTTPRLTTL